MFLRRIKRDVAIKSRLIRTHTSFSVTDEENEAFARRKSAIESDPKTYYPLISSIRATNGKLMRVDEFRSFFSQYEFPTDKKRIDELHVLEGKILSIRKAGKAMYFVDVVQDHAKVQLVASNSMLGLDKDEFSSLFAVFRRGDHISAAGYPGTTNVGELSLKLVQPLKLASPSFHAIPPRLSDKAKINQNRVVDYLVNKESRERLITRSIVVNSIRSFLLEKKFVEVQTPIIASSSKGANATPFLTHSGAIKNPSSGNLKELQLRVAPELWLKKLVVAGFDKVFEIGPSFRNEGIDSTHNPEFTTCEFYQSFTNLEQLITITEEMLIRIVQDVRAQNLATTLDPLVGLETALKENSGFKKIEFIPKIEEITGEQLPLILDSENLLKYYRKVGVEPPIVKSVSSLLDGLSAHYLEPLCQNSPTIIFHQPAALSPLAKSTDISYSDNRTYKISKRFELFIHGREYVNAYEEENSPIEQQEKFLLQQQAKEQFSDQDSLVPDSKYVEVMEWGLPPTGGFGLGIDRLVMLLTGSERIEDVLSFGGLNDVVRQ